MTALFSTAAAFIAVGIQVSTEVRLIATHARPGRDTGEKAGKRGGGE